MDNKVQSGDIAGFIAGLPLVYFPTHSQGNGYCNDLQYKCTNNYSVFILEIWPLVVLGRIYWLLSTPDQQATLD